MRPFLTLVLFSLLPAISLAQTLLKSTRFTKSAGVTLSLPWVNGYSYHDYETGKDSAKGGFMGLGISFYYKHKKSKLSLNCGVTGDAPAPIGPIDYGKTGTRSTTSSLFVETNFHHPIYKWLHGIAGVNFVNYRYYFIDYDNDLTFTRYDPSMGLTAGLEYVSKGAFSLALFYRPALVGFKTKQYWHLISLDARFDLPIWRK